MWMLLFIFVKIIDIFVIITSEKSTLTRIIFEPPSHLKEFITEQGVANKITIGNIKINITGDISFDLEQFCGELSRFNNVIAFLDIPWSIEQLSESHDDVYLWNELNLFNSSMQCYRRQLLSNLSRRVHAPLILFGNVNDCPGSTISSLPNASSPQDSLIFQFVPNKFLFARMLDELIQPSEDKWNGFVIVYDNFYEFDKYSSALEGLNRNMFIRRWSRNDGKNKENLQKILHLKTFFLDLSFHNLQNFISMASQNNMLTNDRDFFVFIQDEFYKVYTTFTGKNLRFLKWSVKGISDECSRRSMMEQYICSFYHHMDMALLETGAPSPKESSCLIKPSYPAGHEYSLRVFKEFKQRLNKTYGFLHDWDNHVVSLNYTLDLMELKNFNLSTKESWSFGKGFSSNMETVVTNISRRVAFDKTFNVVTIIEKPFVIKRTEKNGRILTGNDQYEGFSIDLLKELAAIHKFKYRIYSVETYGTMQPNGTWDGIIGELIAHRATLAVASLTITYDRERVIDFTTPFMSLSLTVIIQKAKTKVEFLQFMEPLSKSVWFSMLGAYLVVSLTLFFIGRSTPKEWYARHPCSTQIENQFTILNSFWFTVGSLMQQGCEISPRATSTRIIGTIWWFFILIMVSSYTANLAAFLTIERLQSEIENVEELSRQDKIRYGTVAGGSTYAFFNSSDIDLYKRMWHTMKQNQSNFVNNTEEGIKKVLQGDYAYILESTMSDFHVQRECDLVTLGGNFDPRSYAIGLPIGNTGLRDLLSESILKLQKKQVLENLRQIWFMEHNSAVPCDKQASSSPIKRNQLSMKTMSGAFFGLGSGLLMAVLVWIGEIIYWLWKINSRKKDDLAKVIKQQVRQAIFNCNTIAESSSLHMYTPDMEKLSAIDTPNHLITKKQFSTDNGLIMDECMDSQLNGINFDNSQVSVDPDINYRIPSKRAIRDRQRTKEYLKTLHKGHRKDHEVLEQLDPSSETDSVNYNKSNNGLYDNGKLYHGNIFSYGHHHSSISMNHSHNAVNEARGESTEVEEDDDEDDYLPNGGGTLKFVHSGKVTAL